MLRRFILLSAFCSAVSCSGPAGAAGQITVEITDIKVDYFGNDGHAASCMLTGNISNTSKYHLNKAAFRIGSSNFSTGDLPANTTRNQIEIGSVSPSGPNQTCADAADELSRAVRQASVFTCSVPDMAEGDCQALFRFSSVISTSSVDALRKAEEAKLAETEEKAKEAAAPHITTGKYGEYDASPLDLTNPKDFKTLTDFLKENPRAIVRIGISAGQGKDYRWIMPGGVASKFTVKKNWDPQSGGETVAANISADDLQKGLNGIKDGDTVIQFDEKVSGIKYKSPEQQRQEDIDAARTYQQYLDSKRH